MTIVKRLYVMLCGYEILPRTVCTRGSGAEFVMSLPISAYLIETTKGFIVFDCGINADVLRDPALRHRYYTSVGTDPAPGSVGTTRDGALFLGDRRRFR